MAKTSSKKLKVSTIMKPPGGGLLTFSTGSGLAREVLGARFQLKELNSWQMTAKKNLSAQEPFYFVGIPSDCGGGICRGAAHGPLYLRKEIYQKQPKWKRRELGDVPCIPHLLDDKMLSARQRQLSGESLWGKKYQTGTPVSPLNLLEEFLVERFTVDPNFKPFVLGGDHSVSGPVFKALKRAGKTKNLAVLHFDAHTDLLTSRYGVENCFATWTAHALKTMKNPKAWVQLGIRASGKPKSYWERKFGLQQYWAKELVKKDAKKFAAGLVAEWKAMGCTDLYISNDIDGIGSEYAPSTGTPEANGLSPAWAKAVISYCSKEMNLIGADMTEVAPVIGSPADAKKTLKTATAIILAHRF